MVEELYVEVEWLMPLLFWVVTVYASKDDYLLFNVVYHSLGLRTA